jgi:hypothetical protein
MLLRATKNASYYLKLNDMRHKVTLFSANMKAFAKKILNFVAGTTFKPSKAFQRL